MPDTNTSNKPSSGFRYEYLAPATQDNSVTNDNSVDTSSVDLSDLMSKLKNL